MLNVQIYCDCLCIGVMLILRGLQSHVFWNIVQ